MIDRNSYLRRKVGMSRMRRSIQREKCGPKNRLLRQETNRSYLVGCDRLRRTTPRVAKIKVFLFIFNTTSLLWNLWLLLSLHISLRDAASRSCDYLLPRRDAFLSFGGQSALFMLGGVVLLISCPTAVPLPMFSSPIVLVSRGMLMHAL